MKKINFEFLEDEIFFEKILCKKGKSTGEFHFLFDFREPKIKRVKFNKNRNRLFKNLKDVYGLKCFLNYTNICYEKSGFVVDHLIPLSSNKLNKELRKLKAEKGKKVKTQSLGSNKIQNLIIACKKCNSFKKHKLELHQIQKIKFKSAAQ